MVWVDVLLPFPRAFLRFQLLVSISFQVLFCIIFKWSMFFLPCEPWKKNDPTFHWITGCLRTGSLLSWFIRNYLYDWVVFHPLYQTTNQGPFCSLFMLVFHPSRSYNRPWRSYKFRKIRYQVPFLEFQRLQQYPQEVQRPNLCPFPDAPCREYLPTLGEKWPHSRANVGKYSIHGAFGISSGKSLLHGSSQRPAKTILCLVGWTSRVYS